MSRQAIKRCQYPRELCISGDTYDFEGKWYCPKHYKAITGMEVSSIMAANPPDKPKTPVEVLNIFPEGPLVDCGICYENKVKQEDLLTCCDGAICKRCVDELKNTMCPFCRKQIKGKLITPLIKRKLKEREKEEEKKNKVEKNIHDELLAELTQLAEVNPNINLEATYDRPNAEIKDMVDREREKIQLVQQIMNMNPRNIPEILYSLNNEDLRMTLANYQEGGDGQFEIPDQPQFEEQAPPPLPAQPRVFTAEEALQQLDPTNNLSAIQRQKFIKVYNENLESGLSKDDIIQLASMEAMEEDVPKRISIDTDAEILAKADPENSFSPETRADIIRLFRQYKEENKHTGLSDRDIIELARIDAIIIADTKDKKSPSPKRTPPAEEKKYNLLAAGAPALPIPPPSEEDDEKKEENDDEKKEAPINRGAAEGPSEEQKPKKAPRVIRVYKRTKKASPRRKPS